jgi:endonuclease/exonuclease/phosphatase family metal-dependent hydrolase
MNRRSYTLWTILCLALSVPLSIYVLSRRSAHAVPVVRFAAFNVALNRPAAGELLAELRGGRSPAGRRIAEIVQCMQVDVLLLSEVDRDERQEVVDVLRREYLEVSQNGQTPVTFEFAFCGPVNTGEPSGLDLDRDGVVGGPGDAFGYGAFPGQYGMVLLSRHPILLDGVRTFRELPWSAMPGALRPDGYYDDAVWPRLLLSSKSQWDVPIGIGKTIVHALCSHPTPPVFDGPEDRNGCRNHDEIRFWVDYLTPERAGWIVDDRGGRGGLADGERFVLLGDLNCDVHDGGGRVEAMQALLQHTRVQDPRPKSEGGVEQSSVQFGVNARHQGDPALDTGDFEDAVGKAGEPGGPGNLRVDYVLPSREFTVAACGVFWPRQYEATFALSTVSDHRLVYVDVVAPTR